MLNGSSKRFAILGAVLYALFMATMVVVWFEGGAVRIVTQYVCFGALLILLSVMYGRPALAAQTRRRLLFTAITLLLGAVMLD